MRILSTMALATVLPKAVPPFEAETGETVETVLLPTAVLLKRIAAGERADGAILTAAAVDGLAKEGVLGPRTDLARSFIGAAVRAGAPHPPLANEADLVALLLGAPSVVISKAGASGIYMAGLIRRLGLEAQMEGRLRVLAEGYTASLVAAGEAAVAFQQVSELLSVPGIEVVGRLPPGLGEEMLFAGAPFCGAPGEALAARLLRRLADPASAALYRAGGLEPAGTAAPNPS